MNIVARLVKDAEVRTLPSNKQVVNFSVAENDSYKNKNGEIVQQTTFFDCSYWLTPKIAAILTKGTVVEMQGKVSARAWTDKEGTLRSALDFNASRIKLHGGGSKSANTEAEPQNVSAQAKTQSTAPAQEIEEDDLPF